MSPEEKARLVIDAKLAQAGWTVQDYRALDLSAGLGVAVREHPTDTGPADYLLYVDREPVGVIEAKRDDAGENLTATERQTEGYAQAKLKWRREHKPLPFLFESTGQITRFSNGLDRPRDHPHVDMRMARSFFEVVEAGAARRTLRATP